MSLSEIVREAAALQQQREDENTWSRINGVLGRLEAGVQETQDAQRVLKGAEELIVRSMQSDRSRLAGTALRLLKSCVCVLGAEFEMAGVYLQPLAKVCGKSSKVFYSRGEEVVVELCRRVNIRAHARAIGEWCVSGNKNVRLAFFRGVEAWAEGAGGVSGFEGVIMQGRGDAFADVREVCKRMCERFGVCSEKRDGAERENVRNGVRREPVRMVRKPQRMDPVNVACERGEKKELVARFSPARKQSKTGEGDYDKIRELERQVKDIAEEIRPETAGEGSSRDVGMGGRLKEMFCGMGRSRSGAVHLEQVAKVKKETVSHEDLTPVRLSRYLDRYRSEHGGCDGKELIGMSKGFEVKDVEMVDGCGLDDEEKDECKTSSMECVGAYESCNGLPMGVERVAVVDGEQCVSGDEASGSLLEVGEPGDVEDVGNEVGELSRSLANVSIAENDETGHESLNGKGSLSVMSANPYENPGPEHEIENSLREYTIVESVGEAGQDGTMDSKGSDGLLGSGLEEGESGVSIGESTIPMGSVADEEKAPGTARGSRNLKGNRFAGLLELSESSGEETVFCGKAQDGRVEAQEDANDFTAMDSSVEIRRGVFRKR